MLKKTAIIILTFNNFKYTKDCIESIRQYTQKDTYELIVVDNSSTDETREWLLDQPDILLKLNDQNEGFPKGCNIGIGMAQPDSDILLLNNDTIVTPNWLLNLTTCLYSSDQIGAAGAVSNHSENLQGVPFTYDDLDQMQKHAAKNNISDSIKWEQKVFLIGFCLLIKREVIDKIGLLDEAYSPGYVEDNDLSIRILKSGYKLMLCHDCFIHHYLGSEFRKDLSRFYPVLYANRKTFKNKWGFETPGFDEIKFDSLRILNEPDKYKSMNVLELGCGIGVTLLKIKYSYPNAVLFGCETDTYKAKISSCVACVSTSNLDNILSDYDDDFFDYILVGHYPELIDSPKTLLKKVYKKLKQGGCMIATIKNIMHYQIIRELINGNWFLSNQIQNQIYSKYFTLKDFSSLLADCGFVNQYSFHWFSVPNDSDKAFIQKICELRSDQHDYDLRTHLYSIRAQK